jgi:dienelactone hydrolase
MLQHNAIRTTVMLKHNLRLGSFDLWLETMIRPFIAVAFLLAGHIVAADDAVKPQIEAALKQVSPHVVPEAEHDQLRSMVGRSLREQIAAANRASSAAWSKIESREDWERFRLEKLAALRTALGPFPKRSAKPRTLVTRTVQGDGFQILNLIYESRPGLVVTANLYAPDPLRDSMPGILLSHSHHNPKHEGELQDMGMTWARAGCYVLVPDHLGHGERRQHPFVTAADYKGSFQVGRQDYYFRYDTSLQLYLVGETLMGWLAHDLMTGVDQLLAQPGIDAKRIILLGSVAGGGDPAAVTAALDERIACVVPFNFGGPQPESKYPLPEDAETSFNYAGGGSWESTRNLYRSAADGFLPWVIVGSIAPRHLIHAHEFSWDREHDPVWKRYGKIWELYGASDRLAFAHGHGTLMGQNPMGSHCNNIGAVQRRQIHEAFRTWFHIDVKPEGEFSARRTREELTCLTDDARQQFQPQALHEILASLADERLASARKRRVALNADQLRKQVREDWTRLLGNIAPPPTAVRSFPEEQVGGLTIRREILNIEPGIQVPLMVISENGAVNEARPLVVRVAADGIAGMLKRCGAEIAASVGNGNVVALVEVRGTGESCPGAEHGQQAAITANSATALMLGQPLLAGQLRDLRAAWRHLVADKRVDRTKMTVIGESPAPPLPQSAAFSYPRRIDRRPAECLPQGALLALLLALFEDDIASVETSGCLVSFRSVLDSSFVQVPHESIVPGILLITDLSDLAAVLAPRSVVFRDRVDGQGRAAAK